MMILMYLCLVVYYTSTQIVQGLSALNQEPVCSKFDFEIRTLETMLRTENNVEKMKEEMEKTQRLVMEEVTQIADFKAKLMDQFEEYKQLVNSQTTRQIEEMNEEKKEMVEKVETKLQSVDEQLNQQLKPDTVIAFSVADATKQMSNGVPTFKRVITNIGDFYNKDTGLFTSPVDGLYMFVLSIGATTTSNTYCRIRLNGSNVLISQSQKYTYITATNAVYLLLVKGDTVSPGNCGNVNNFYDYNGAVSFSGALVKQTN